MVLKSWNPLLDKIHRRLTESISECKSYNLDNIKGRAAVRTENWEGQRGGGTGKGWREGQVGSQEYFQWKKRLIILLGFSEIHWLRDLKQWISQIGMKREAGENLAKYYSFLAMIL